MKRLPHMYVFQETALVALYLEYLRWARCSLCENLPLQIIKNRGKSVLEKSALCTLSSG